VRDVNQLAQFLVKATTERDIETPEPAAVTKLENRTPLNSAVGTVRCVTGS
jgi:hypothetical protein